MSSSATQLSSSAVIQLHDLSADLHPRFEVLEMNYLIES